MLLRFLSSFIIKSFWVWFFFLLLIFSLLTPRKALLQFSFITSFTVDFWFLRSFFCSFSRYIFGPSSHTKEKCETQIGQLCICSKKKTIDTLETWMRRFPSKKHTRWALVFEKGDDFWVSFGVEFFNVTCERREKWFILSSACWLAARSHHRYVTELCSRDFAKPKVLWKHIILLV